MAVRKACTLSGAAWNSPPAHPPVLAVPQGEPANRGSTCPKHQKQTVLLRHAAYCGCHSLNDGWQNGTGNGPVFGKSHSVQLHWDLWGTI